MGDNNKFPMPKKVIAILSSMCIGATIFGTGFALGDKLGFYNNKLLQEHVTALKNENIKLKDKIVLYESSESELQSIIDKINAESVFYINSYNGDTFGENILSKKLSYGESLSFKGLIYIAFSGYNATEEYYSANSDSNVRFAQGTIDFAVGTYKSETKHYDLKPGDTVRFILDGDLYVILLKHISIGQTIFSPYPDGLKLSIGIYKVAQYTGDI